MEKKLIFKGTIAELQNTISVLCELAKMNGLTTVDELIDFMLGGGKNEKQ